MDHSELEVAGFRKLLIDTFRSVIDPALPVALVDFPNSINAGDHSIWLGEKSLLRELGNEAIYECSAATYNKPRMAESVRSGTICMHGGGNFGDIYPLYQNFRLQVMNDFPKNPIVIFPQTTMFFSNEALRDSADVISRHENVTIAARDALSHHLFKKWFGKTARVVLAPDMAFMLTTLQRSHAPEYRVACISRNDPEGIYGPSLAIAAGLILRNAHLDLGSFDDGFAITANAGVSGSEFLLSDWYQMRLPGQVTLDAYQRLSFDERSLVWVNRAIRMLSYGRVVVTDRLHGHILCTLVGIPHVLLNNSYGKNISYYETWSRPGRLSHLAASPPEAWSLAQRLLGPSPVQTTSFPTDTLRWTDQKNLLESWRYRSERAAQFLPAGSSKLLDIGCGQMTIEQYLPKDCEYVPHDLIARDQRTLVHDLNKSEFPSLNGATHVTVLGVLEYLNDPEGFWIWLAKSGARVILSYAPIHPSFSIERRRSMGWFNDFSKQEIVTMAEKAGFALVAEEPIPP